MNRQLISLALGNIREDHITAALCYEKRENRRFAAKRLILAALAAAFLLAAVTAYAAGLFGSLFARIGEQNSLPDPELYDHAGELSNKEPETVALKDLPGNTFTLSESFYDGETLLLAYSLDSMIYPVQFGFGPGDENFDKLISIEFPHIGAPWEKEVSAEDREIICEALRGEEDTGFVIRSTYLGDHIRLTDGTDLGPNLRNYTVDGNVIIELQEGLPAAAKNQKELELAFAVRETLSYYYKEGGVLYQYTQSLSEETVTVSVPKCGAPPHDRSPDDAGAPAHINTDPEENGGSLVIDADITSYFTDGSEIIVLKRSGDTLTTYEDLAISKSGEYLEPQNLFRYNAFTDVIPGDISFGPEEAVDRISRFFEEYSIFTYLPYKTMAATDGPTGYYTVWLRSCFEDIPVCLSASDGFSAGVHASVSNDGIFYYQGMLTLAEIGRRELGDIVSADAAIQAFTDFYSQLPLHEDMMIYEITCEYILCNTGNGLYELRPGWCFYGTSETGEGVYTDWVFKYDPESEVHWSVGTLI